MLTMHRTFSGVSSEPVYYVADGGEAKKLTGAKATKWLNSLKKGTELLSTANSSADAVLLALAERGVYIFTAHWHSTGIEKKQTPEKIAAAFSLLDKSILRDFVPRPDLVNLRSAVMTHHAVVEYRKAAMNRLGCAGRFLGVSKEKLPAWLTAEVDAVDEDARKIEPKAAKIVIAEAKKVKECLIFNQLFGMKEGLLVAGQFVSRIGDISRFPTVSSLWHYCGMNVVDGKAPGRKRGHAQDWNSKVRTTLWKTVDVGLKNNVPAIRGPYEKYRAAELAVHDEKCPNCKTKEGHCGSRARRRVIKDFLKDYYAAVGGAGRPLAAAA